MDVTATIKLMDPPAVDTWPSAMDSPTYQVRLAIVNALIERATVVGASFRLEEVLYAQSQTAWCNAVVANIEDIVRTGHGLFVDTDVGVWDIDLDRVPGITKKAMSQESEYERNKYLSENWPKIVTWDTLCRKFPGLLDVPTPGEPVVHKCTRFLHGVRDALNYLHVTVCGARHIDWGVDGFDPDDRATSFSRFGGAIDYAGGGCQSLSGKAKERLKDRLKDVLYYKDTSDGTDYEDAPWEERDISDYLDVYDGPFIRSYYGAYAEAYTTMPKPDENGRGEGEEKSNVLCSLDYGVAYSLPLRMRVPGGAKAWGGKTPDMYAYSCAYAREDKEVRKEYESIGFNVPGKFSALFSGMGTVKNIGGEFASAVNSEEKPTVTELEKVVVDGMLESLPPVTEPPHTPDGKLHYTVNGFRGTLTVCYDWNSVFKFKSG